MEDLEVLVRQSLSDQTIQYTCTHAGSVCQFILPIYQKHIYSIGKLWNVRKKSTVMVHVTYSSVAYQDFCGSSLTVIYSSTDQMA